jgi:hypothetical protein
MISVNLGDWGLSIVWEVTKYHNLRFWDHDIIEETTSRSSMFGGGLDLSFFGLGIWLS